MLWSLAEHISQKALLEGELFPLISEDTLVEQDGIVYVGNVITGNMKKKHSPDITQHDPFLPPYNPDIYLGDMGTEHVCLLNKFPITVPHILVCAKHYIPQTSPLSQADFSAWVTVFSHPDVLGFFNSGHIAGSSQMHRHMQLVRSQIPLESQIVARRLPFKHVLSCFESLDAEVLYQAYISAMQQLDLYTDTIIDGYPECHPYNILLTQRWMLVIPRTKNQVEAISGHGINFSGRFLVSSELELAWLKEFGFIHFLAECSVC
ncbi:phosphorylase [Photobacterium nomapromontoriensis]|uniref:phosphorylase n=1 Tax=Photobacterium nomapromontoriensis TaxID=2910237 RepID=UPI003D114395